VVVEEPVGRAGGTPIAVEVALVEIAVVEVAVEAWLVDIVVVVPVAGQHPPPKLAGHGSASEPQLSVVCGAVLVTMIEVVGEVLILVTVLTCADDRVGDDSDTVTVTMSEGFGTPISWMSE
jgi:hypothetical protein